MSNNEIKLEKKTLVFSQDGDSSQEGDLCQELTISKEDGGAGDFYIISTNRWVFDKISDFVDLLKLLGIKEGK